MTQGSYGVCEKYVKCSRKMGVHQGLTERFSRELSCKFATVYPPIELVSMSVKWTNAAR